MKNVRSRKWKMENGRSREWKMVGQKNGRSKQPPYISEGTALNITYQPR